MNSEFNDMERIFQEGLQNYEVTPPAHVWGNIQKQKRKALLFYKWKIASIILLLCIAGASAFYYINKNNNIANTTVFRKTNKSLPNKNETESVNNKQVIETENYSQKYREFHTDEVTKSNTLTPENSKKITDSKVLKTDNKSIEFDENENSVYNTDDLVIDITSKDKIKLKYLIYPSLMQYVYSTKRIPKNYSGIKEDKETNPLNYKYSVEIVFGPSYAFRKLSGNGDLLRNESEKAGLSGQTGLKINYHLNQTWSVQSGLTIENRNEKIKYNHTEIQDKLIETPHQVIIYHPILPLRTITVIDSTYSKQNVTYKYNSTNKYTSFNIPVVLGYNFIVGKLQYRISTGPLFTVYSINTASNLNRSGSVVELVPYKESTKIKASGYSAVALQYPWNSRYSGMIEFSYYTNLTNRFKKDAALVQKNYGFNLSAGLKINLIKE